MAEGGHISHSSGSEFIYDFYCELCADDGKQLEANGYCSNCEEYLCEECYNGHKRSRLTRHHVLVDKSNMPKDAPLSSDRASNMISTMCKSHTEKVVEFYCKSHGAFVCSTCFFTEHRGCPDVENILEKSDTILESQEYKSFILKLKSVMTKSEEMLKLSCDNKILIRTRCSDAVCVVRKVKEEAVLILEEIESNFVEFAEKLCSECEEQMENLTKEFSAMSQRIEAVNSEVESLFSSKRVRQLYIKMKEAEKDVISLQESMRNAERKNVVKTFTFDPNHELKSVLNTPDILGKISYQDEVNRKVKPRSSEDPSKTRAAKVGEIDVRSLGQSYSSGITGSAVLSKNRVIITDNKNDRVKLVDSRFKPADSSSNIVISELNVSSKPWDVTTISPTQAAVTLPRSNKILLLRVGDKLYIERELTVRGNCQGIAYSQNRLIVTYTGSARLEIIDLRGNVIRTIDGREMFDRPWYVCVSRDGKIIYVSDSIRQSVTSLTCEGVVTTVYTDVELKCPNKVCTDHRGNVYVCCEDSKNVHMITADCKKVKVILTQAEGLDRAVYTVSHCQDTNRLFIGMWGLDNVKVYQLS